MLEAKANVKLDGNEIVIVVRSLIKESKEASLAGKFRKVEQLLIITQKFLDAKEEFHDSWAEFMSEEYVLDNKKAAVSAATTQNP